MSSKDVFDAMELGDSPKVREKLIGVNLTKLEKKHGVRSSSDEIKMTRFVPLYLPIVFLMPTS